MTFKKWFETRRMSESKLTETEIKVIYNAIKNSTPIPLSKERFNIWKRHMLTVIISL